MPHSEALTALKAAPTDLGLIRYAVGSTLLPHHVAELITNLSLVARVSLRATAFFLEVILEATKMGTGMGLGLTRRALISAIGATRTMQALTGAEGGGYPLLTADEATKGAANNAIFAMLDKYTAVGIYVVHHSLTMTELFAMSGISLVQDSLRAGFTAAEASVQVLDGVFGSNETSRALSSFIDLVRKELFTKDGSSSGAAGVKIMAGITRAITTFAIVQAATHRRTARSHKMKVLYDCTVLGETSTSSWEGMIMGPTPGMFRPREAGVDESQQSQIEAGLSSAASTSTLVPRSPSILESELDRSRSFYATHGRKTPRPTSSEPQNLTPTPSIAAGLDYFCGDEEDSPPSGRQRANIPRTISVSRLQSDEELRPTVKAKLNQYSEEELRRGVVVDRQRADSDGGRELRQVVRRADDLGDPSSHKTVWEVITETTEITETIEEHEEREEVDDAFSPGPSRQTSPHPSPPRAGNTRRSGFTSRIRPRMSLGNFFGSRPGSQLRQDLGPSTITETDRDVTQQTRGFESERMLPDGGYEKVVEDEEEWQGISRTLSKAHFFEDERGSGAAAIDDSIPSVGNGLPQESPRLVSASSSVGEANESTRRMRVVLKRVRKKLIKTTRVVTTRDVVADDASSSQQAEPVASEEPSNSDPAKGGLGFRQAVTKAKSTLTPVKGKPSSPSMLKVPERHGSLFKTGGDVGEMPASPTKKRHSRVLSQASIRSYASRQHASTTSTAQGPFCNEQSVYPQGALADNLHRFMRYASACYGHNFMNILGIGDPYQFRSTKQTHANVWAFAHHIGIPFEDVLLSSYSQETDEPFHSRQMTPIVNFVAVDRAKKAVVLACRGTLGLSDILVDLTCDYKHVELSIGQGYVHSGIFDSAASLAASQGAVKSTIVRALEDNPDYGLITVGHSLGGGVAACLALLWSCRADEASTFGGTTTSTPFVTSADSGLPADRAIHSYAYGPPAITDAELSVAATGLITSVVHNFDVVPSLSLGTIRDFKQIAEVLKNAAGESCTEILGKTIGMYQSKPSDAGKSDGAVPVETKAIFPIEAAEEERCLTVDKTELIKGKTRNRATDAGYIDPNHRSHSTKPRKRASHTTGRSKGDDLEDWLWSLIKTMRAHAQSDKLYPPGAVLCLESFDVYVRRDGEDSEVGGSGNSSSSTTMSAHRVILRRCEDVRTRFAEPVFCRTLFRDHSPAGYEFCLDLLKKAQE